MLQARVAFATGEGAHGGENAHGVWLGRSMEETLTLPGWARPGLGPLPLTA